MAASLAAGIVVATALWGPGWHEASGEAGAPVVFFFWMTVAATTGFTIAAGLLPLVVMIGLAEVFKVRSLLAHVAAGAAFLLLLYYGTGAIPASYEESIDHPPPPISRAAEVAVAAGAAFGLTYWLIAGRTAGRWRERGG